MESRVLIVAPQPYYEDRGTPIAVHQLTQALSHLGHRVDIVTYPIGRPVEVPGVRYFRAANPFGLRHVPIGFSMRKILLDLSLLVTLGRRLREERYQYIHALEEAAFPAVWLGRRHGIPVVYDMQSSLPEQLSRHLIFRFSPVRRGLEACERWLIRRADVVVCSTGLAERVRRVAERVTVREWQFHVSAETTDQEQVRALRRSLGIALDAPVALYSGTFEWYQGLSELVAAVPFLREQVPRAVLVLLGSEGREGEKVARKVKALGLDGAIVLVERQPRDRVPQFLAMADVLVSPRIMGGNLPLKIFDYLAAGRPIVATDIATHRNVLDEGRAILVAPGGREIAGAIADLLRDPARSARMAAEARAYATEHLGWTSFVHSVNDLVRLVHGGA